MASNLEGKFWLVLIPNDVDGQYELHRDPSGDGEPPYSDDEGCYQFPVEFRLVDGYPKMEVRNG